MASQITEDQISSRPRCSARWNDPREQFVVNPVKPAVAIQHDHGIPWGSVLFHRNEIYTSHIADIFQTLQASWSFWAVSFRNHIFPWPYMICCWFIHSLFKYLIVHICSSRFIWTYSYNHRILFIYWIVLIVLFKYHIIIQIHPMIIQMWPHLGSYGQQERRTALAIRGL